MENRLYTIGYATKKIEDFIALLKKHNINCLVDVRTNPFSKAFPEYNKDSLDKILKKNNIKYLHFGKEFGARRNELSCYDIFYELKGEHAQVEQVSFEKVYSNPNFLSGVQRIEKGLANDYKICFMCSEKYPINCHRFWMVGYYFAIKNKNKYKIVNIIDNETDVEFDSTNISEIEELLKNKKIYKGNFDYKDVKEIIKSNSCYSSATNIFGVSQNPPKWYLWWDNFNQMPKSLDKLHLYNNILIGYKKGAEEDD